jgi:hypothetical protein
MTLDRSLFNLLCAGLALIGLMGCDPVTPPVRMVVEGAATAPDAGPGQTLTTASAAGKLFAEVCLATAPSFVAAPLALSVQPFTQNSTTGTYYHNSLNLSFKLLDRDSGLACSLVFAAAGEPDQTYAAFVESAEARFPQANAIVQFEVSERFADASYYHVVATPK